MKQIGIITYYNAPNYGAFLQAYALYSFLSRLGHSISFLNPRKFKISKDSSAFNTKRIENIQASQHLLTEARPELSFDVLIYGSDEIWNLRNKGYSPALWGWKYNCKKRIAYAPSIGNTKVTDFFIFPYTVLGLNRFTAISVRDINSFDVISKFSPLRISEVLDPTFLISYSETIEENIYGDYVFVYSYGMDEESQDIVRSYAKQKGLKVISTGSEYDWTDLNLTPTPFEWVSLIHHAKYMFTSTFHGTVFAILNKTPFSVLKTSSPKILDILSKTHLGSRMVSSNDDQNKLTDVDYSSVYRLLEPMIANSKNFLLSNI